MKLKRFYTLILSCIACFVVDDAHAAYTIKDGWFVSTDEVAKMPPEEHFNKGAEAIACRDWYEGVRQFGILSINFPNSPLGQVSNFWLGVCYFYLSELDFANNAFTAYLGSQTTPQYFEETIRYKFEIANRFRCGAKKRLFGTQQLPKWAPADALTIEIFDEVIAAVPCHDLAAQSLYMKGWILWNDRVYGESVDVFAQLIRRFPKHELAPESYLAITDIYLEQSQVEFQNPDLLGLAEINVRKFQQDFPGDERLYQAEFNLQTIKETYAYGLYCTGLFYERICKPWASVIYYQRAMCMFPDTFVAQRCNARLTMLDGCCEFPEVVVEPVDDDLVPPV